MSFSIDGKSWDDFRRSSLDYNPNYFSDTLLGGYRPRARLYDYSYGQVRDAAEKLGIKNINKSREEFKILDLIRNPQAKDPAPAPVPVPAAGTAAGVTVGSDDDDESSRALTLTSPSHGLCTGKWNLMWLVLAPCVL